MTDERRLVYIHKLLHEQAKHKQGDLKDLQTGQVKRMKELLGLLEIEDGFAGFVKDQNPQFLAAEPNTSPSAEEIHALQAMGITALSFPCIRIAENGKSARGMSELEKVSRASMVVNEFYGRCHYSTKAKNYNKPYGLFYSKKCSCAGTASALKLVLKKMGFKKIKHKNKGKHKHQWCVLKMDGKTGWADGMIGWAGYGKYLNKPVLYGVYPFF